MPAITEITSNLSQNISDKLDILKVDPTGIQNAILDHLAEITDATVDIVDPTNPFIFLLEASAVTAASGVNESLFNLRVQYPYLARDVNELYNHMSDKDYIDQFAIPSTTNMWFMYKINDLMQFSKPVVGKPYNRVTIPVNTEVAILDDLVFSLQYPIILDVYGRSNIVVRYDTTKPSPLLNLPNHIITHSFKTDRDNNDWIFFSVNMEQFRIHSTEFIISSGTRFNEVIEFVDEYYHCRVYYKSNQTANKWREIITTHTDMVFDPTVATALLSVSDNKLNVIIPEVYIANGDVSGTLRVDVYYTKGKIYRTLANIEPDKYITTYLAIDVAEDTDEYTAAIGNINSIIHSSDIVNSGRLALTFNELKTRVINHTVGPINTPITEEELITRVNNLGFEIYKAVDVVTDRTYIAHKWLPSVKEINDNNVVATIELTREELIKTKNELALYDNIKINTDSITILSNTLFSVKNGILEILSNTEVNELNQLPVIDLVDEHNTKRLYFNPFYYVLKTEHGKLDVWVYDLDIPTVKNINILAINDVSEAKVDINNIVINKAGPTYTIEIVLLSNEAYKTIATPDIGVVLRLNVVDSNQYVYVNGVYSGLIDGEPKFIFTVSTNYNLINDGITLIDLPEPGFNIIVDINNAVDMYLYTTSVLIDNTNINVNTELAILNINNLQVLTKESADINFGTRLNHIWDSARISFAETMYKTHTSDVHSFYSENVYSLDPATGSKFTIDNSGGGCALSTNIKHYKGDPVLDGNGDHVVLHHSGDTMLDEHGVPIIDEEGGLNLHCELVLIDSSFLYSTHGSYVKHLRDTLTLIKQWMTVDLPQINSNLLELTKIEYAPINKSGMIDIGLANDVVVTVNSRYSPIITVFITDTIKNNNDEILLIQNNITEIIIQYLRNVVLNHSELKQLILSQLENVIEGLQISGFAPLTEHEHIKILSKDKRFSIRKNTKLAVNDTIITDYAITYKMVVIT